MRFFFLICLVFLVGACSSRPQGSEQVSFASSSPRWLDRDDIIGAEREEGRGYLLLPESGTVPYPSVVMLHSSLGVGTMEVDFAQILAARGFAVLVVDSFSPRKVQKITDDQTEVSEASILADLFAAYKYMAGRSDIDASRVSVVGFSKGGLPALYSAFEGIYTRYGFRNDPFRSHLSFYPWCGVSLLDWEMGAPVQIHSGGADEITPAALCKQVVDSVKGQAVDAPIELFIYDGQRHAFTHPRLAGLEEWSLPVGYPYPKNCRIAEQAGGRFVELSSGKTVSGVGLSDVIASCSVKGARVAGDEDARALAYKRALAFLESKKNR